MNKIYLFLSLLLLLTGCSGDKLAFHKHGSVTVRYDSICINSLPGDKLEYYLLSSSENNHQIPLVMRDNIKKEYPETCFPVALKAHTHYELIYVLGGENYRFEFATDARKNAIEKGN